MLLDRDVLRAPSEVRSQARRCTRLGSTFLPFLSSRPMLVSPTTAEVDRGLVRDPLPRDLPSGRRSVSSSHNHSQRTHVRPRPPCDAPDFLLWKLDSVARLGFAAFALDMFGTGRALWDRSESMEARRPVTDDRSRMQARAMAALETLRQQPEVDPDRVAAIGYCFGGMPVLDLARLGNPPGLRAVATLHGVLKPMAGASGGGDSADEEDPIVPRVLVLHAAGDPFVSEEEVRGGEWEERRRLRYRDVGGRELRSDPSFCARVPCLTRRQLAAVSTNQNGYEV